MHIIHLTNNRGEDAFPNTARTIKHVTGHLKALLNQQLQAVVFVYCVPFLVIKMNVSV